MHIHLIINLLTAQVIHTCLCQRSTLAAWFSVSCRRILFQNPRGLRCTAPRQCQEAGQHAEDTASLDSPEDRTNQGPKSSWIFSLVLLKHITTGEEKTSTTVPPPKKTLLGMLYTLESATFLLCTSRFCAQHLAAPKALLPVFAAVPQSWWDRQAPLSDGAPMFQGPGWPACAEPRELQ